MSKPSFTPGKWVAEDWRKDGDWRSTGIVWARDEFESAPGRKVCEVSTEKLYADSPKEKLEEFEANARLIAQAPAMYEFLKRLTADCNDSEVLSFDCDKLRALKILEEIEGR